MKVTLELTWKNISFFAFNNKDSCFSTLFLEFLKSAYYSIANFDVDNFLSGLYAYHAVIDVHLANGC